MINLFIIIILSYTKMSSFTSREVFSPSPFQTGRNASSTAMFPHKLCLGGDRAGPQRTGNRHLLDQAIRVSSIAYLDWRWCSRLLAGSDISQHLPPENLALEIKQGLHLGPSACQVHAVTWRARHWESMCLAVGEIPAVDFGISLGNRALPRKRGSFLPPP